jgi:hypothetical protein
MQATLECAFNDIKHRQDIHGFLEVSLTSEMFAITRLDPSHSDCFYHNDHSDLFESAFGLKCLRSYRFIYEL